ncbi:hypothetical protein [Paenibacillus glucanolyticus]|uniref:hypothetical protein n=1 Tax=Paenibacillus glucanolyticus TaxID=59843 RepID=UPI00128B6D5E|nr:hypothetical protein [Paenibacillus glucanolyticus]MPY20681.1 hypothetical protein [Paenibacillus glucanolyticus]
MKPEKVDKRELNKLFLAGKPIKEIALQLGSTSGSIRTMIYHERLRNPLDWPQRVNYSGKPDRPLLMMHGYECAECAVMFTVEDDMDVDHSVIVCPVCQSEDVGDKGYGKFVTTSETMMREA